MVCNSFNKKTFASIKIKVIEKKMLLVVLHQLVTLIFLAIFFWKALYKIHIYKFYDCIQF